MACGIYNHFSGQAQGCGPGVWGQHARSTEKAVRGNTERRAGSRSKLCLLDEPDSQERREHMPVLTTHDLGGTGTLQSGGSSSWSQVHSPAQGKQKAGRGPKGVHRALVASSVSISLPQEDPCVPPNPARNTQEGLLWAGQCSLASTRQRSRKTLQWAPA